jgi:hypothetical protein
MKKFDKYKDEIKYVKIYCECGHSIEFLQNHSAICSYCGKRVYPSKESEFREILSKKIRRNTTYGIN